MRVLVAGATGFVGRRLVAALVAQGHTVCALVRRLDHGLDHGLSCDTVLIPALDRDSVASALRGARTGLQADAVINLAAAGVSPQERDVSGLTRVNALFPADLVTIARDCGTRAFLQIGSSAEYARPDGPAPIPETAPLESERLYGASKAAGSLLVQACGASCGVPVAVLRLFHAFGPGEGEHRLLTSLITRIQAGQSVPLSAGLQVRDFVSVDDVCRGILAMLGALVADPSLAGVYNLGGGVGTTVADFARTVARVMNADPGLLQFGALPMRPDDYPWVVAATGKLKHAIGWKAGVALEDALRLTAAEILRSSVPKGGQS